MNPITAFSNTSWYSFTSAKIQRSGVRMLHVCAASKRRYWNVVVATLAVAASSMTIACKSETVVSGKPVGHWIKKLEDRDRREWTVAFNSLRYCTKEDLEDARPRLREMAVGNSIFSRRAALLLFDKFDEVDSAFADAYLATNGDDTFVWGGSAIKALAGSSLEGHDAALAAMERKLQKVDQRDRWAVDLVKISRDIRAASNVR